jgi:hypothetical protein
MTLNRLVIPLAVPALGAAAEFTGGVGSGAASEVFDQLAKIGISKPDLIRFAVRKGIKGAALLGLGKMFGMSAKQLTALETVGSIL